MKKSCCAKQIIGVNVLQVAAIHLSKERRERVKRIFSLMLLSSILIVPTGYAKTMYVTDTLNIMVRRQPGLDFKIVDQLSSNAKVNRIATEESWSKISFGDNKVGWVLNRYLTEEIPKPVQIEELKNKAGAQAKTIEALEKENFTLKQKKVELAEKVSTLTVENQKLKEEPFRIMMLLTGVGIFLVGCIVTLILQRTGKSRRSRLSF